MFKFIIDIFCKDTVIGIAKFNDSDEKHEHNIQLSSLYNETEESDLELSSMFIGPCVYRL